MRGLDDTDRTILRLLVEDGRRSWREIADRVGLSPPAVSDRVDRLRELGVIRRFTADVDRAKLDAGTPVLVEIDTVPKAAKPMGEALSEATPVEQLFVTADDRVVFSALLADEDVIGLLDEHLVLEDVEDYEVSLLADREWTPSVGNAELALECAECGNTVTSEGESERLDGELYHFCCGSCRENFVTMYHDLRDDTSA
jgi:Lrp/AsnC family leucine-responsive transcriptional regulator